MSYEEVLEEGTRVLSPTEQVRQDGPDWPLWTKDDTRARIPTEETRLGPGSFYLTRVEGEVYAVARELIANHITVFHYKREVAIPYVIGQREAEADLDGTMRRIMENFPGYLIRWSL